MRETIGRLSPAAQPTRHGWLPATDVVPLSRFQQRLWHAEQLQPGAAGHAVARLHLRGDLSKDVLRVALAQSVASHQILRATFELNEEGKLVQTAAKQAPCAWLEQSVDADEQIETIVYEMVSDTVDLSGPLLRARLLRLAGDRHVLLMVAHALICDPASLVELLDAIRSTYSAIKPDQEEEQPFLQLPHTSDPGKAPPLLQAQTATTDVAFWRRTLEGAPVGRQILPDVAPAGAGHDKSSLARCRVVLSPALVERLYRMAREQRVTLPVALMSAWAVVLARWSNQDEVVIGSRTADRAQELERLIGPVGSIVPVRIRLQPQVSFAELLKHVAGILIECGAHDSIEDWAAAGLPDPLASGIPIFEAVSGAGEVSKSGDIGVELHLLRSPALCVLFTSRTVVATLTCPRDAYGPETVERVVACWEELLESVTADPVRPIAHLSMLTAAQRHRVVCAFNETAAPYPQGHLVHELFEEQVRCTPDAIAVIDRGQTLTYAELNAKANQLAHLLHRGQVTPGEYIPIAMPRCLDMVVAQLAVLKCGAAYVPLDPQQPMERIAFVVRDCGARRLLIQEPMALGADLQPVQQIEYALASGALANESRDNLRVRLSQPAAAYVMYTSGSTGIPKGVVVPHRGITRLVIGCNYAQIERTDCIAHSSNPAFDAATFEIWASLLHGARLLVVPQSVLLDARRFAELIADRQVTVLWITVGLFTQYADALAAVFSRLRYLITGGDVVEPGAVRRVLREGGPVQVLNAYGPTESTTFTTTYPVGSIDANATSLPIGRPISNTRVYILDSARQPVPVGVIGEIYIGGDGLALGYLNRPELTAERFLPDPFSSSTGARMYRSGDLGRWRPDGNIEFHGRNDQQVKLRGFRIELGEIEAQLTRHPQIREAVVVARTDVPGSKYLAAYLTVRNSPVPDIETLRTHVLSGLPEYMAPSAFVVLDSIPLTPNGKPDRRALPVPHPGSHVQRQYEAPIGPTEQALARIWQSLLRIEHVGRRDGFFELGGHSLLIVQMMERLRELGLSTHLRNYYECTTLADLANVLQEAFESCDVPANEIPPDCRAITPAMLPLVELNPEQIERIVLAVPGGAANIQDIYPLTPLQEGILFHHKLDERGGDTYVLPLLLRLSSRQRLQDFIKALQQVIDRHDILRTAVLGEQLPRPVQVVYRHAPLPVQDLAADAGADPVERLTELMKPHLQKLDLRQAPPLRMLVASGADDGPCYALLQLHHLVCDHESVETMLDEVRLCCEARAQELPPPVPYRNHVAQVLAHARTQDAETFFREKLGDVEEPTAPFGIADVYGDGSRISRVDRPLELHLAQRIRAQARRLHVSPATLFHAAWALVVAQTSGRGDVVFGTVLLGRLQGTAGAQRTLGMFINTLPLRLRLEDVAANELVDRVQRELVELLNHEHASLSDAQRCSAVRAPAPLFSTLINYLHSTIDIETGQPSLASGVQVIDSREWTNYPIALSVYDQGAGFVLMAKTDRRIDPLRVTGYVCAAMQSLLDALDSNPQRAVLELSTLPDEERREVVDLFNATQRQYPHDRVVQELFEEQVERTPDAPAVVSGNRSLTFAALNGRANQLARYLRRRGVGPDCLVGLCVERSVEMVVGLLGVLKAGGAYVPLDPDYPDARLAAILRDAAPNVVLTQEHLRERLPGSSSDVVALDGDWQHIATGTPGNLVPSEIGLRSEHLAYVIYTSGSTGEPKGVMIEHRNLTSLWQGLEQIYEDVGGCARVAVNASFNFDASVKQFIQLLSGRTIVIVPQDCRLNASSMLDFIDEHQVESIDCTPSQLKTWVEAGLLEGRTSSLRLALVGGEPISSDLWLKLAQSPHTAFFNVYGPTESTVDTTFARLRCDGDAPHIGPPMQNRQVYILDRHRQPVPIGVAGEIYIGGAGVARGYLNRPELTAERFIPDRFTSGADARLYRSGDVGRWRTNGCIEYLGRNDEQVKVRGYRIELGEIEAQLLRHQHVKDAVVLARMDDTGDRRIVAYVVPDLSQMKALGQVRADDAGAEMVDQWNKVHDETYSRSPVGPNFVGWDSSYTGQPIPAVEMQEWLDSTVERIRSLRPNRVLEIGCGVGLVLQHLAPQCSAYVGADFAASALGPLRRWLDDRADLQHVTLLHRAATDLNDLSAATFDTVVLNSVVQYFPDIEYLLRVLRDAVRLLAPGGRIFIGDVRDYSRLSMFHAAVQLSKASATLGIRQLRNRIARAIAQDKELVIDPRFFRALPGNVPGIAAAHLQVKRGRAHNELTRYRYDVILTVGNQVEPSEICESLDWHTAVGSMVELERAMAERRWAAVRLQSIPDERLSTEVAAQSLIDCAEPDADVSTTRQRCSQLRRTDFDPDRLWDLGAAHGYDVVISPAVGGPAGCFDAQLFDRARREEVARAPGLAPAVQPWAAYANEPLENGLRQQLIPQVREHLKARLPEYMVPSFWIALKQLPLTPNGKVDRKALPAPQGRPEELGEYVAPRNDLERTLAGIWAQLLRIDQVGIQDNFLELGGHSLLATRVITHISDLLDVEIPLRVMFEQPTIEALSNCILRRIANDFATEAP